MQAHKGSLQTPHRDIWALAWPMILSNISVPLLTLVDTALLGHLQHPRYLGAVAIGGNIIVLVYWAFSFLRMGTTGLSAQSFGARQDLNNATIGYQALLLGAAIGLGIWLFSGPVIAQAIAYMQASPELSALAREYCDIRLFSAPAVLVTYAIVGWFIGRQNTRIPLILVVSTNLLNVVLDVIFIKYLDMNSRGAAMATAISEYVGLAIGLGFVWRELATLPRPDLAVLGRWAAYKDMLVVNRHLFVRTLALLFCFLFFVAQGSRQGEVVLAGNAILLNLLLATAYGLDGFANAAEALAGKAIGERRMDAFYAACRGCLWWCAICALGFSLAFYAFKPLLLPLFTSLPDVLAIAESYYPWLVVLPLVAVWTYFFEGVFIGATRSKLMRDTMLFSVIGVYVPVWYFTQDLGNHGLWLAFTCLNIARSVSQAIGFYVLSNRDQWLSVSRP